MVGVCAPFFVVIRCVYLYCEWYVGELYLGFCRDTAATEEIDSGLAGLQVWLLTLATSTME